MPNLIADLDALIATPEAPMRVNRVMRLLVEIRYEVLVAQHSKGPAKYSMVDLAKAVDRVIAAGLQAPQSVVAGVSRVAR